MSAQAMDGIVDLRGPAGGNAGYFNLPEEFNQKLYASQWTSCTAEGAVEKARQIQPIIGTNKGAVGWEVWKYPVGHPKAGQSCKATVSKGTYILMFRKRTIQDNVNAIYGNVSKRHIVRQQTEAIPVAPNASGDSGVLSSNRLNASGVRDFGDDYEMNIPQNSESSAPLQSGDPDAQGTAST